MKRRGPVCAAGDVEEIGIVPTEVDKFVDAVHAFFPAARVGDEGHGRVLELVHAVNLQLGSRDLGRGIAVTHLVAAHGC